MSDTKVHYLVLLDKYKSGKTVYGVKDAFPVESIQFASGHRTYSGEADRLGTLSIKGSSFTTYRGGANRSGSVDDNLQTKLIDSLRKEIANGKANKQKVTLIEVAMRDGSKEFYRTREVEHPDAELGEDANSANPDGGIEGATIIVSSDEATLGALPAGKTDPTDKTHIDFVGRTVNNQS